MRLDRLLISTVLAYWSLSVSNDGCVSCSIANRDKDASPTAALEIPNTEDFYELVTDYNRLFVDKSLLIRDLLSRPTDEDKVALVIQPVGYGKTVNLNMLKRYLQMEVDDDGTILPAANRTNRKLFFGGEVPKLRSGNGTIALSPLKISDAHPNITALQGEYPVVTISFKEVLGNNLDSLKLAIGTMLTKLFADYPYLRRYAEQDDLTRMVLDQSWCLREGIWCLCKLLYKHFGGKKKVILLIDDYDAPMLNAYFSFKVVYEFVEALNFYGQMLTKTLKDNEYLERAVLTGTIPVHRCDLRLIGASVYTVHDGTFSDYYGFTEDESRRLLSSTTTQPTRSNDDWKIRARSVFYHDGGSEYAGKPHSGKTVYDPLKVFGYLTNDNASYRWKPIQRKLFLSKALLSSDVQDDLHTLLSGGKVPVPMVSFDLDGLLDREVLRRMLLFSGYFKAVVENSTTSIGVAGAMPRNTVYELSSSADEETESIVETSVLKWLCQTMGITESEYRALVRLLNEKNVEQFSKQLKKILSAIVNLTKQGKVNTFFRGFMLGTVNVLTQRYQLVSSWVPGITSNQTETSYDLSDKSVTVLIPKNAAVERVDALVMTHRIIKSVSALKSVSDKGMELIDSDREKILRILKSKSRRGSKKLKKVFKVSFGFCENKVVLKHRLDNI